MTQPQNQERMPDRGQETLFAVRPYHHAVALLIASLAVFLATGTAYFHFFRKDTAIEQNFLAEYNLANIYLGGGDLQKARIYLERAIRANPDFPDSVPSIADPASRCRTQRSGCGSTPALMRARRGRSNAIQAPARGGWQARR